MSHLQGVVFIAVLCAVNAAVTINVYEDDVETIRSNKAHGLESCDTEACDRICRLLGFNSGICVGDTCKCRKSHNDYEAMDNGIPDRVQTGCSNAACSTLCHILGYRYGVCINSNTCKCSNALKTDDQLKQNDIQSLGEVDSEKELGVCDPNACYQLCHRLKFPSGTCINGRCKCDNFRPDPEAMDNGIPDQVQTGCTRSNAACSTLCHILGYRYGVCTNSNTCECSNVLRTDVLKISLDQGINEYIANAVEPNVDTVAAKAVRECDQVACMRGCLELGAPGGSCVLGKCRCNKRDKEDKILGSWQAQSCYNVSCYLTCLRWGYFSGSCRDGSCLCV